MPRLDPGDPRDGPDQRVEVGDVADRSGLQHRARLVDRVGEELGVAEVVRGELDEVRGGRVVAGSVEADRRRIVRVLEPELASLGVHHRHEPGDRAVADVVGEVLGRVIGARQHHRDQQVVDRHPVARLQPDLRIGRRLVIVGIGVDRVEVVNVLEHDQRRHQLGRRRDRVLAIGVDAVEHLPGRRRVQRGGGHRELGRRCGERGCGDGDRCHRRADQRRRHPGDAAGHRRSLSRSPVCSAFGEMFGFNCSNTVERDARPRRDPAERVAGLDDVVLRLAGVLVPVVGLGGVQAVAGLCHGVVVVDGSVDDQINAHRHGDDRDRRQQAHGSPHHAAPIIPSRVTAPARMAPPAEPADPAVADRTTAVSSDRIPVRQAHQAYRPQSNSRSRRASSPAATAGSPPLRSWA